MDNGHAVKFVDVHEDAFYFQVDDDKELESDTFEKSKKAQLCYIRNWDSCLLVVGDEDQLQFKDSTVQQEQESGCRFTIQAYNDCPPYCPAIAKGGRAITLSAQTKQHEQKAVTLVCCNENEVHPKTIDVPGTIENTWHEALFFLKSVRGHKDLYMVQSSRYTSRYLGFEVDAGNPSLIKLVLRESPTVEVDKCFHLNVQKV